MATKPFRIAITSVGSGIGQSVVDGCRRSSLALELHGFDINPFSFGGTSCDYFAALPPAGHAEYLGALTRECHARGIDVLIPGLDPELTVLAENCRTLESSGIRVVVATSELVGVARDKLRWGRELSQITPIVLPSYTAAEAASKVRAEQLSFPLVAKPAGGSGSVAIRVINSLADLADVGPESVVQPFVAPSPSDPHHGEVCRAAAEGRLVQSAEISIQALYGRDGRLIGRMASHNRLKNGIPIEVVPIDLGAEEAGLTVLESHLRPLGLRGPINLQGRMTEMGLRLFEMNPRFTGISGLRARLGFNEVEAAIRDALDLTPVLGGLTANPRRVGIRQVADQSIDLARAPHLADQAAARGSRRPLAQNVLVTGATGWLARHLTAKLIADPRVASLALLTRRPEKLRPLVPKTDKPVAIVAQVSSAELPALAAGKIDLVYHLASGRPVDPLETQADSLQLTATLLQYLAKNGLGSLVNISSQSVYGLQGSPPWTEEMPPAPETPYGMSKWAGELMAQAALSSAAGRVTSLRLARIYGAAEGLRWYELPHLFAQRAARGLPIVIKGGAQRFDLIHIRDAVAALLALLDDRKKWQPAYNVGGETALGICEIADAAVEASRSLGAPLSSVSVEAGSDCAQFGMCSARFRDDFGFKPEVGLDQAMRELVSLAMAESAGRMTSDKPNA